MPSRYQGSPREVRALCAYINLVRAAESLLARLAPNLKASRLTECQFGVLEALYHVGPMCQSTLGEKILRSGGNVTLVVDNLERRGLARRVRDRQDRRFVTVRLTAKGWGLVRRTLPRQVAGIVREMSSLAAGEQEALRRLCRRLGKKTARELASTRAPRGPGRSQRGGR